MKTKNVIIGCFLLIATSINAQITFQKTFKETDSFEGNSVIQTSDNGYIITGVLGVTGSGNAKLFLIKCNEFGDKLWSKTYGGPNDVRGMDIKQTTDDGYIVVGWTRGFGAGNDDIYLLKTDSVGDTLWTKTYGGAGYEYGFSVQQTIDGGYIIAGQTTTFGAGGVYLIKTNSNGDTLWTKTYGGTYGNSVQQTVDGGYIITGYTQDTSFNDDVYLIKTDSNGDTLWTKTYGGVNTDIGNSVQQTTDGGYIILGYTGSWPNYDVYVIKTDAFGDTLWVKTYGNTNKDQGHSIQQTSDGGYIFTGLSQSFGAGNADVYLVKTDSSGAVIWTKAFGSTSLDYGNSVKQTTDGGYIICGFTGGFGASGFDVYLIKTDATGNSGCNQSSTSTIVSSIPTIIGSGAILGSGTMVNNTATIVNTSATIDNVLCSFTCNIISSFTSTATNICEGESITFTNNSSGAISYEWKEDGNIFSTDSNTTRMFNTSGAYIISLIAYNGSCTDSSDIVITVYPTYSNNTPDITICDGDSVLIFDIYRKTTGTYYDTLVATNSCDSVISTNLIVNPSPPKPIITQNGNTLASTLADSYQWYYYDTLITGAISQYYSPTQSGFYSVMITDANACLSTSDPFTYTISGIIDNKSLYRIQIYPNPNTGEFTIEMNIIETENIRIEIVNILGQVIFKEKLKQFIGIYKKQLDLKKYPTGKYNLQLISDEGIINRKIIIE